MTATERADAIMNDWFGKRWNEDSWNVNLWSALATAIEAAALEAVRKEREEIADLFKGAATASDSVAHRRHAESMRMAESCVRGRNTP